MKEKLIKNIFKITILLSFIVIITWFSLKFVPILLKLMDSNNIEYRESFIEYVDSLGMKRYLFILTLQIIQVFVVIIPGEAIEIISGMLIGPIGGLLICLLGILISNIIIIYLVKELGSPLLKVFFSEKKIKRFAFLEDTKKLNKIVFFLFFLPGTPKDLLTYLFPLTKVKTLDFLFISIIARIPSILTSTLIGAQIIEGNTRFAIIISVSLVIISLVGILVNHYFTKRRELNEKSN